MTISPISPIDTGVQRFVDEMSRKEEIETAQKIDRIIKDLEVLGAWAKEIVYLSNIHLEIDEIDFNYSDLDSIEISSGKGESFSQMNYKISIDISPIYQKHMNLLPVLSNVRPCGDNCATLYSVEIAPPELVESKIIQLTVPLYFYYCDYQMRVWAILSGLVYHKYFKKEIVKINIISSESGFGSIFIERSQ